MLRRELFSTFKIQMKNSRLIDQVLDLMLKFLFIFNLVEPNFFSKNHLWLGKTLLRENKKEEAKVWLEKAASSNPRKTVDDDMVCTLSS